jgi:hypothetical protein
MNVREVGMACSDWELAARIPGSVLESVYLVKRKVLPKRAWYYLCFPGSLPAAFGSTLFPPGNFPWGVPVDPD